jgi:hypothetical protein
MSKSFTLSRARHGAAVVVGFLTSLAAVCVAAPAAFAVQLDPAGQSTPVATTTGHGGIPGWGIAVIVIGALMVVGLLVAAILRWRRSPVKLQHAVN